MFPDAVMLEDETEARDVCPEMFNDAPAIFPERVAFVPETFVIEAFVEKNVAIVEEGERSSVEDVMAKFSKSPVEEEMRSEEVVITFAPPCTKTTSLTAKRDEVAMVPEPPPEAEIVITPVPPAPLEDTTDMIPEPTIENVEVVISLMATEPPPPADPVIVIAPEDVVIVIFEPAVR
jgi:hypothetical protein